MSNTSDVKKSVLDEEKISEDGTHQRKLGCLMFAVLKVTLMTRAIV